MPDWKRRYEDEFAIVDRVWLALGIRRYEDANGKSVDQIVAETIAENAKLRADLDEAVGLLTTLRKYHAIKYQFETLVAETDEFLSRMAGGRGDG